MVDPFKLFWVLTNSSYLVTKFIRTGIADKNDTVLPYFEKSLYEINVDENARPGTTIFSLRAVNHNLTSYIRYEISGGGTAQTFDIIKNTGDVVVTNGFDYETKQKYQVTISVSTRGRISNSTTLVINVIDCNDLPPVFEKAVYRAQITEEDDRNLPKKILQVKAIDQDKDRPHFVVYFPTGQGIDPDNPANSKFEVNRTTGEIFVMKPLDRDLPNGRPQWRFTVFAQDEGGDGLVGYSEVQLNLKDINDNAPLFPMGVYHTNVTENSTAGQKVLKISAVDYDDPEEGGNAKLVYSIEKNVIEEETGFPIFEIESTTGLIRTAVCCLDREKTPDYSIQVVAMDGGGLKGTGTVVIKVKDINDMPPSFVKEEWLTEVDETFNSTVPTHAILTVTVHDNDETNNFTYRIVENSGYGANKFEISQGSDGTGSLRIKEPLDFEDPMQRNGFRFKIQVTDIVNNGTFDKYHSAMSWVVVKLRDINDNEPVFEKNFTEVSTYENTRVGKLLWNFRASDVDNGGKSNISYAIDRFSDKGRFFRVNNKGDVFLQRSLDREKCPRHGIKVLAIDDGSPPKTATASFIVQVQDINDNAPTLMKDYRPIVPEHVPPQLVAELQASDKDDPFTTNGAPFKFFLDPNSDEIIKAAFKVEQTEFDSKENTATVYSMKSFDREFKKEYLIPILIQDSGRPSLTGTSTLTVTIGDINDNKMQPGNKNILVYNFHGSPQDIEIGRVFVYDADDWDYSDKIFKWDFKEHQRFRLNEKTGMIQMRHGTKEGVYNLKFKVTDYKHNQYNVSSNVIVTVKDLPHNILVSSGSIRFDGINDENFIREWNYQVDISTKSKRQLLLEKLSELLNIYEDDIDIFSIQSNQGNKVSTDIIYATSGNNFDSVKLNGVVMLNYEEVEKAIGLNITMVGINECPVENINCGGSCSNVLEVKKSPYLVDSNTTALVSVKAKFVAQCNCAAKNTKIESCRSSPCFNGGLCIDNKHGISCSCPSGFSGPRCQQIDRSFQGNGWAWFPHLEACDNSHLSLEFITRNSNGLFLYNGPILVPKDSEDIQSDFISLEIQNGYPRMLLDFGSGTLELKIITKNTLDDGEWHRLDIFWDTENVKMVVDFCKTAEVKKIENGSLSELDYTNCQVHGVMPLFNEYFNVNTPLQLGGLYKEQMEIIRKVWKLQFNLEGFNGCLRNVIFNTKLYDLAYPGLEHNSYPGCSQADELCNQDENTARCWYSGSCVASYTTADCKCKPGWTGSTCTTPTTPITFKSQSYVKYALSFEPDRFTTNIQLRFRTRENEGELFRMSDQHNREYCILEIRGAKLHFRYNLNSMRMEENDIWLDKVLVNDGYWHVAKVNRYGSAVLLEMDGGEGVYYNETFIFEGQQWLFIDKQEGVYAGGKVEFTGIQTFGVIADFRRGCLDDLRLDGKPLPLPPAMNGTQWGQATLSKNLLRGCPSNTPCVNIDCAIPFVCVDLWNKVECRCAEGQILTHDGRACTDKNECVDMPCQNGGKCINQDPTLRYTCVCPEGFWGKNCEIVNDTQIMMFSMSLGALTAIFICLIIIFIVVPIFLTCNRRREAILKGPGPEKDVRENVINYADEGGGEDDMTAFDITALQIPVQEHQTEITEMINLANVDKEDRKKKTNKIMDIQSKKQCLDGDSSCPPFDDLRNYAYEGSSSNAGSLHCYTPDSDEEEVGYDGIDANDPRFEKFNQVYNIYQDTSRKSQANIRTN